MDDDKSLQSSTTSDSSILVFTDDDSIGERRYTRNAFISLLFLGLLSLLIEVVYVLFNYVVYVMGSYREMPIIRRQIRQEAMAAAAAKELQAPLKNNNSKDNFQQQQQKEQPKTLTEILWEQNRTKQKQANKVVNKAFLFKFRIFFSKKIFLCSNFSFF